MPAKKTALDYSKLLKIWSNPIYFPDRVYTKLAKQPENEIPTIPRLTLGIGCAIL